MFQSPEPVFFLTRPKQIKSICSGAFSPDVMMFSPAGSKAGKADGADTSPFVKTNGGHIWMFFAESLPAVLARKFASFILTKAMNDRPELGFDSYDRFFPNQDRMPSGEFGNLIALPL
jgi:hypothetical protein